MGKNTKIHTRPAHKKEVIPCSVCGELILKSELRAHLKTEHPERRRCNICGRYFDGNDYLDKHLREQHSCQHCHQYPLDPSQLESHIQSEHPAYKLCPNCNKVVLKTLFNEHLKKSHRMHRCELCGKFFKKAELKEHWRTHSDIFVDCPICKVLVKRENLDDHILLKHQKTPNFNKLDVIKEKLERSSEQIRKAERRLKKNKSIEQSNRVEASKHKEYAKLEESVKTKLQSPVLVTGVQNFYGYKKEIRKFIINKWEEINSIKRVFALSNDRAYDIIVSETVLQKLGFEKFRFYQSKYKPPAVGVNLIMEHNIIYPCSLNGVGELLNHQRLINLFPFEYQLLLNLAAVVYYADLVIPMYNAESKSNGGGSKAFSEGKGNISQHQKVTKRLPRYRKASHSDNPQAIPQNLGEYGAMVDPFRRRLPAGQKPSFLKIIEADSLGINLQGPGYPKVQYTIVKEHTRGNTELIPAYQYDHGYQATKTFRAILDLVGLS